MRNPKCNYCRKVAPSVRGIKSSMLVIEDENGHREYCCYYCFERVFDEFKAKEKEKQKMRKGESYVNAQSAS